jgi:hypothetical protein
VKRFRRALIWGFTFGFGAIWVLAFFLPSEVGGGIDRHGSFGPDLVGNRLYYTSAVRAAGKPLTIQSRGTYLLQMDLDATRIRQRMFDNSIFRGHDYFGQYRPTVLVVEGGLRALFLGIGSDDRRRICLAESMDGTNWRVRPQAVFDAPAETSVGGPEWMTVVDNGGNYILIYSANERGRRILHHATSTNLVEWEDRGAFLRLPEPESILSFSPLSGGRAVVISRLGTNATKIEVGSVVAEQFVNREPLSLPMPPFADEVIDAKVFESDGLVRMLLVGGRIAGDTRLRIALLEGDSLDSLAIVAGSQPDGSIAALGSPAASTFFHELAGNAADFVPTVMTFGFGLGLISLLVLHGRRVAKGGENRFYSVITLIALIAMIVVQIGFRNNRESQFWKDMNELLFMNMQFPLGATMFGLLAAYLVSAAYRAFRIRTFDAAVLTAMAALVVLTQVPTAQFVGSLISDSAVSAGARFDAAASEVRTWSLLIVNNAVQTAVGFGAFVGAIAMALRIWLSLDKTASE